MVVPGIGLNSQRAGRTFAEFGGEAARRIFQGTNGIHAQARFEIAGERVADVKTVQSVEHLVFCAAVEVEFAIRSLNDTRHQFHGAAKAASHRVRNV